MIELRKIQKILALLAEKKHSQRTIAKMMGVSRGSVNSIASGKRRIRRSQILFPENDFNYPKGDVKRCPQCGALTKMPCLACQIRNMKKINADNSFA